MALRRQPSSFPSCILSRAKNLCLSRRPRCLVLAPTRELAVQISDSFKTYGKGLGLGRTVIFGGVGQNPQVDALRKGVDILIATPGRLMDLMEQRHVELVLEDDISILEDYEVVAQVRERLITSILTTVEQFASQRPA